VNEKTIDFDTEFRRLEEKIGAMTEFCSRLKEENRELRVRFEEWSKERATLVEKAAIAKNRVEAMISRLKSMGHEI
jgi:cell division protein ZapB